MTTYHERTSRTNQAYEPEYHHSISNSAHKVYSDKLSLAKNVFQRVNHYISELEILISSVIKIYCGPEFSEKARIQFLFEGIHDELHDFVKNIKTFEKSEVYSNPPISHTKARKPESPLKESLQASTFSGQSTLQAVKNEVRDLIYESKEAVDKLKEENATIQALMKEKNHNRHHHHSSRDHHTNRNREDNFYSSPSYRNQRGYEEEDKNAASIRREEEVARKYADLNRVIDGLNRKKEENFVRLTDIENRLTNIKREIPEDDGGALTTSDLSQEDERLVDRDFSRRREYDSGKKPGRAGTRKENDIENYKSYLKRVDEIRGVKRQNKEDHGYEKGKDLKARDENERSHKRKTHNKSQVLQEEINGLNKEISTIKNLLDSALLQKQYQSK